MICSAKIYNISFVLSLVMLFCIMPADVFALDEYEVTLSAGTFEQLRDAINTANGKTSALINLTNDITVTSAFPNITSDITIYGAHTLLRDNAYTGGFFNVSAGSSLTLDGGIIIDGGNNWTFNEEGYFTELLAKTNNVSSYAVAESGAPISSTQMLIVSGTLNVNYATVTNNWGASMLLVKNGGIANFNDGALFTHSYRNGNGAVANIQHGGALYMYDGSSVEYNVSSLENGEESQDFVFDERTIMTVMKSNNGTFSGFSRMFYANFTGVESFDSVTATVIVIADSGVVDMGKTLTLK